jgi:hypothetical protein
MIPLIPIIAAIPVTAIVIALMFLPGLIEWKDLKTPDQD